MGYEITELQQLNLQSRARRIRLECPGPPAECTCDVRGYHYAFWPDTIRRLIHDGFADQALALTLECVDAAERDAPFWDGCPAPWYTETAATIYRRRGDYAAEIALLARFDRASLPAHRGHFGARIAQARALGSKGRARA
ncbi:MAG: hypothetical protein ACOH2F_00525 [Cellulomonas sp.]